MKYESWVLICSAHNSHKEPFHREASTTRWNQTGRLGPVIHVAYFAKSGKER
jgi:hypothetical protein